MGNKSKPTALKVLQGNPGKRKLNKNEPVIPVGKNLEPPEYLDDIAIAEWRRVVPILEESGVLTLVDVTAMAAYCAAVSMMVNAQNEFKQNELIYEVEHREGGKTKRRNPWVDIQVKAFEVIRAFSSEFGLTPSSRSKIQLPKKKQKNGWAEL